VMKTNLGRLLLLFPLLGLTSCGPHARPAKFSIVSEGGLAPEAAFREHGYYVKSAPNGGVSDPVALKRWYSWQGVLSVEGPAYWNCGCS
jgi:hypothetical protein